MYWIALIIAGLLEVVWATALPKTEGFTNLAPSAVFVIALVGSMWLLAYATKGIPLGTAYPVWVGIGAIGAFVSGVVVYGEPLSAARVACAALLVASIVGLKLTSPDGAAH